MSMDLAFGMIGKNKKASRNQTKCMVKENDLPDRKYYEGEYFDDLQQGQRTFFWTETKNISIEKRDGSYSTKRNN